MRKISFITLLFVLIGISPNTYSGETITKNLYKGISDNEVIILQKFLNKDINTTVSNEGPGSPGLETSYFGEKTLNAVIRFQNKYPNEILIPNSLLSGNGFVGSSTRSKINSLIQTNYNTQFNTTSSTQSQSTQISKKAPLIKSITPVILEDGGTLTILGEGFTEKNKVIISIEPNNKYTNIKSTNNGSTIILSISTDVAASLYQKLSEGLGKMQSNIKEQALQNMFTSFRSINGQTETGDRKMLMPVSIKIENENGTSDSASTTINIYKEI